MRIMKICSGLCNSRGRDIVVIFLFGFWRLILFDLHHLIHWMLDPLYCVLPLTRPSCVTFLLLHGSTEHFCLCGPDRYTEVTDDARYTCIVLDPYIVLPVYGYLSYSLTNQNQWTEYVMGGWRTLRISSLPTLLLMSWRIQINSHNLLVMFWWLNWVSNLNLSEYESLHVF